MTSKTQVMHNIFLINITEAIYNSYPNETSTIYFQTHEFSDTSMSFFLTIFRNTIHFYFLFVFNRQKPHDRWFLKWYVCLQCNIGHFHCSFWPYFIKDFNSVGQFLHRQRLLSTVVCDMNSPYS